MITDQERQNNILRKHKVYSEALANELLELLIEIAGERLLAKEKAKVEVFNQVLKSKAIRPEYQKLIYQQMLDAKEHLK